MVLQRRDYFVLRFTGITPRLSCCITKRGTSSSVWTTTASVWDLLIDFDVNERRTLTGQYYCDECLTGEFFVSRELLWVNHSLNPLLAWTNGHFHPSQWLCLFAMNGTTYAELVDIHDLKAARQSPHFVEGVPVIIRADRSL